MKAILRLALVAALSLLSRPSMAIPWDWSPPASDAEMREEIRTKFSQATGTLDGTLAVAAKLHRTAEVQQRVEALYAQFGVEDPIREAELASDAKLKDLWLATLNFASAARSLRTQLDLDLRDQQTDDAQRVWGWALTLLGVVGATFLGIRWSRETPAEAP